MALLATGVITFALKSNGAMCSFATPVTMSIVWRIRRRVLLGTLGSSSFFRQRDTVLDSHVVPSNVLRSFSVTRRCSLSRKVCRYFADSPDLSRYQRM